MTVVEGIVFCNDPVNFHVDIHSFPIGAEPARSWAQVRSETDSETLKAIKELPK